MITWTEIPCTDLSRVQTFYSTVFGWTTNPSPHEEVAIFSKGLTNGSFVKLAPEAFLSPAIKLDNSEQRRVALRVTINVESIDEKLKEIEKAGGSLYLPKKAIGDMGFVAYFLDTEKNVLGIWSMN
ncbi:hypothetical protein L207DRAFT_542753 [Hyaloscypha variabilis F]|uniref:Glyoxalase/Bleomycin resistance-like N-terminal domain-containing protein n=1 Tax=Hyaloscypha variabilis (strain UAMH 11265 / GT02V1 / F) TaxID=1149755 RepID=A0A2J6RYC3_HYAVF|nr:hypothetical protein L207DRAFT_542753 [Hyaloscypha variabilis F]